MLNRLLRAALLICVCGGSLAQTAAPLPAVDPPSMRFEWVKEGPSAVCGPHCREWIAATGPITSDTARDFELFAEAKDVRGAMMVLDSGGGSVLASLDLGRKLREYGIQTSVGRTVKLPAERGEDVRAKLSPRGECASMCVFVLLGGMQRQVPAEARILVHQIWPGSKRQDASAESYTADEMVRIQRDVGKIAKYTVEMGGDIELFELAMRIPPWERLRALSQAELRRIGLQTADASDAPTSGATEPSRPRPVESAAPVVERGWLYGEGSHAHSILRRHAITVEGDEIGKFELALSCGDSRKSYKVAYLETRSMTDEAGAPVKLQEVTLSLGGERAKLKVQSSASRTNTQELESAAGGTLSAALAERMSKDPSSVIIVDTRTSDKLRTSIRVGAMGFAKAFAKLSGECGR